MNDQKTSHASTESLLNDGLGVGFRVTFAEEKRPYTVRAAGERYLVCTKPFNLRRTVLYTVIDLLERVRGTENLVFGSGAETDEHCTEMLKRLEGRCADTGFTTEVSHRNRIHLNILRVESPNAEITGLRAFAESGLIDGLCHTGEE